MESKLLTEAEAKTGESLLAAMGNVVATWQGVEHAVFDLFLAFYRPHKLDSASVTFFAVRTFEARLTVIDNLIRYFSSESIKDEWGKILKAIRRKGSRRNAVAHGICLLYKSPSKREFRIAGTPFDMQRNPEPEKKQNSYSAKELECICFAFSKLTMQIADFSHRLHADLLQQPSFTDPQTATQANEARYPLRVQTDLIPQPRKT